MNIPIRISTIMAFLLLSASTQVSADYPLEIIPLQSRTVGEVLPVIKPFIDADGSISGMQNKLIIRTSPANLKEIQTLLAKLDKPARQLMISVAQGIQHKMQHQGISTDISTMVGKNAKVVVGQPSSDEGIRFRAKQAHTRGNNESLNRVRVLEGHAAFIATGRSIPIKEHTTVISSSGAVFDQTNTRFEDATTGFYAKANLHGDSVSVEISPHMKRWKSEHEGFNVQYSDTVITGKLGEWLAVGGSVGYVTHDRNSVSRHYSSNSENDNQIYIKVEEISP